MDLEHFRKAAAEYLQQFPGTLHLPEAKRTIAVRPPTGPLLSIPPYNLLPTTLQAAVFQAQANRYKAKFTAVPMGEGGPSLESRCQQVLNDWLLVDAKYEEFETATKADQWLLCEFAQGRLEPLLPEELGFFAAGPLEQLARAYTAPPSTYLHEFLPGVKLAGTVTGFCLDVAAAQWRAFFDDRQHFELVAGNFYKDAAKATSAMVM